MAQEPMYQQIAEELQRQIQAGELVPGQQLPTEKKLGEEHKASRNTVRQAIQRLMSLGLVETRPGQGTFVTMETDPFVTVLTQDAETGYGGGEGATYLSQVEREQRSPSVSPIKVEMQGATPEIAKRLRVPVGTHVVLRHQQRFIDKVPWSLQTSFFPLEFVTSGKAPRLLIADDISEGTVRYLEDVMGIKQTSYRDWITGRAPDVTEQSFFGIPHDGTVFEIFRTAYDQKRDPMRVTVTIFPVDRNQFIVNVGDPPDL